MAFSLLLINKIKYKKYNHQLGRRQPFITAGFQRSPELPSRGGSRDSACSEAKRGELSFLTASPEYPLTGSERRGRPPPPCAHPSSRRSSPLLSWLSLPQALARRRTDQTLTSVYSSHLLQVAPTSKGLKYIIF